MLLSLHHKITVCPRSSDPFLYNNLLYKMGHYFLDIQYWLLILAKYSCVPPEYLLSTDPRKTFFPMVFNDGHRDNVLFTAWNSSQDAGETCLGRKHVIRKHWEESGSKEKWDREKNNFDPSLTNCGLVGWFLFIPGLRIRNQPSRKKTSAYGSDHWETIGSGSYHRKK